ncbi:MAG: DNA repair protein RecN [Pelodictyon luteolum]|uniref:DNA repair protein RecN n=1 Tax=Pelodictyon luteolum TaxID=1100 RepID=A0A165LIH6_PELLU|nr:DNA repair protein RecN [Pelodictyon luteolum]KZK74086.1 MAG: DNA repair protein RecN [Pelodictyon luteolum]
MLHSLYIRNFALIEELSLEFQEGLTVITGETGAGKSILLGALGLVLGDRASSELVRSEAPKAVIEAVFRHDIPAAMAPLLESAGIEAMEELILRRELSATGQSRSFINDTPCNAGTLRLAGDLLIDLHGQHEHQMLLNPATHIGMLDDFALTAAEASACTAMQEELGKLRRLCREIRENTAAMQEKRDLLEFQQRELADIGLGAGESEEIDREINLLENAETLAEHTEALSAILYEGDGAIYPELGRALHIIEKLAAVDPRFEPLWLEAQSATGIVDELYRFNRSYASSIDFNPTRLESLRERQHKIQRTAKKYGVAPDELPDMLMRLEALLAEEGESEERLKEKEALAEEQKVKLSLAAAALSKRRQEAAGRLEETVMRNLTELGIPKAVFLTRFTHDEDPEGEITLEGKSYRLSGGGYDTVEFMLSANPGEAPRPLAKIASGGEISRVMLAMKSALAGMAELPILIFDEIDTGISGRIAQSVAKKLQNLSRLHQIIAITHLPQIAAMGEHHMSVHKAVENGRTATRVTPLDRESRREAIAALISGEEVTPSSRNLADELLQGARSNPPNKD